MNAAVLAACERAGIDLDALLASAEEVVLFGSHAAGVASLDSDIDLLCVGRGRSTRSRRADVIWLSPGEPDGRQWLGSELGAHVARYGRWLKGTGSWRRLVRVSTDAIRRKKAVARARAQALLERWDHLATSYRAQHLAQIRQELQRLEHLRRGEGCPPTPLLALEPFQAKPHELGVTTAGASEGRLLRPL